MDETTGIMVNSSTAIVKHYMSFWFWIDLASIIPFDMIAGTNSDDASQDSSNLKTIRSNKKNTQDKDTFSVNPLYICDW